MRNGKLFSIIALIIIAVLAFVALYGLGPIKSVEDSMKLGLDIEGGVVVVYEAQTDVVGDDLAKIMSQTKSVLSKRVDQLGLTEPNISIQGENRIRIELPGVKDVQEAMDVIGQTAQLKFIRVYEDSIAYPDMTINDFHGELILTGKNVSDAGISSDQYGNPAVSLKLDRTGAELFKDATIAVVNYEEKRGQIAILLDDLVISAPYTNEIIPGGEAIITGSFDFKYAQNLSTLIRGGALPVDLVEVQTGLMGPILGIDALKYSVYAAGIIKIDDCDNKPYLLKKDYEKLKRGFCYIRKGSHQMIASREDYDRFYFMKEEIGVVIKDYSLFVSGDKGLGRSQLLFKNYSNNPTTIMGGKLEIFSAVGERLTVHQLFGFDKTYIGADFTLELKHKSERFGEGIFNFESSDCLRLNMDSYGIVDALIAKITVWDSSEREYTHSIDNFSVIVKGKVLWKIELKEKEEKKKKRR